MTIKNLLLPELLTEYYRLQAEAIRLKNDLMLCKSFIEDKSRSAKRRRELLQIIGTSSITGGDKPFMVITDDRRLVGYLTLAGSTFTAVESNPATRN